MYTRPPLSLLCLLCWYMVYGIDMIILGVVSVCMQYMVYNYGV
jgi:hypothetical protein